MKFKLVEKLDYNEFSESILSQYLYDAVDELENASLERYIEWFRKEIPEIDQPDEDLFITCVRDAYIQLIDYGEISQPKTMITSKLKEYIESHTDIIDDTNELMKQCPDHLQHELKIVLSKLDESLTEELLTEKQWFKVTHKDPKHRVKDFYVYSVDISDAEKTLDHIYKITGGNHAKQSFDNSVKNDLLITYPDRTDVNVFSYTGYPSANLISRIDRSFRHEATATVKTTKIPFSDKKFYVHHEDGKEHNQSLDNLMIWSNNDSALAHIAHLVAHDSRNYSVAPYTKSINIYDYDTTTGNWIVVAHLNVTY